MQKPTLRSTLRYLNVIYTLKCVDKGWTRLEHNEIKVVHTMYISMCSAVFNLKAVAKKKSTFMKNVENALIEVQ
jgi:hypothetical protein